MLTGEVSHVAVCGMLWNCLFPAQFPEFWYTDVHAEMDAVSERICGGGGGGAPRGGGGAAKPPKKKNGERVGGF